MLALKRKSPVLDPKYHPGFRPVAQLQRTLAASESPPSASPGTKKKKMSPACSVSRPKEGDVNDCYVGARCILFCGGRGLSDVAIGRCVGV